MENKIRYSIIYAEIRPEISERISVGIVFVADNKIEIRYSENKLKALEALYPKSQYEFVSKVVRSMSENAVIRTADDINYLTRYSNNLISFSSLQTLDASPASKGQEWLFHNYVSVN